VIEISQRTTFNLTKCVWVCVYTQAPHALAHPNFDMTLIHSTWTTHASKDQKGFYGTVMYDLGEGEYEKDI